MGVVHKAAAPDNLNNITNSLNLTLLPDAIRLLLRSTTNNIANQAISNITNKLTNQHNKAALPILSKAGSSKLNLLKAALLTLHKTGSHHSLLIAALL